MNGPRRRRWTTRFRPSGGRHRHSHDVRSDGLAAVLGPLLRYPPVRSVTLVDLQSGMVLDACGTGVDEPELLGARHAELMRSGLDVLRGPQGPVDEQGAVDGQVMVLADGDRCHHALRAVADPHGDGLVLVAVVHGSDRQLRRVLRRLRRVPVAALTAGPSLRRPVESAPDGPAWATTPGPTPPPDPSPPRPPDPVDHLAPGRPPSPPSAMPTRH